ncbi:hypothetical protein GOODEAATRI_021556, partial [Goodea atripinnis]
MLTCVGPDFTSERSATHQFHVCLQLYLEVLPEDKGQWIKRTKEHRAQYEKIKEM